LPLRSSNCSTAVASKDGFVLQARELKSVYLKAKGSFLKMLINKCYINPMNLFNQVGLIAINVLGQPLGNVSSAIPQRALGGAPSTDPSVIAAPPGGKKSVWPLRLLCTSTIALRVIIIA
jgi:hypothetical protein